MLKAHKNKEGFSMKKGFPGFLAGLLCGGFLFGGSVAYAAGIVATPFSEMDQKLTLNGNPITLTGYNINGNNYFMLRDIGRAVGFSVAWNGSTAPLRSTPPDHMRRNSLPDSVAPTDGSAMFRKLEIRSAALMGRTIPSPM